MRHLSNKEKKQLDEILPPGFSITKKDTVKEENHVLIKNEHKYLIRMHGSLIPHLHSVPDDSYPCVFVDRGAIPHIANGADLMRPGIQEFDEKEFTGGALVLIKDKESRKTIAIGETESDKEVMKEQQKGKAMAILHYVGDDYY